MLKARVVELDFVVQIAVGTAVVLIAVAEIVVVGMAVVQAVVDIAVGIAVALAVVEIAVALAVPVAGTVTEAGTVPAGTEAVAA